MDKRARELVERWRSLGTRVVPDQETIYQYCADELAALLDAEPETGEITLDDVLAWADGIAGALGTEHARRVTTAEEAIADAILARQCDCENPEPDSGAALVSNECPVHNLEPRPKPQEERPNYICQYCGQPGAESSMYPCQRCRFEDYIPEPQP
jgi:hypothetical protein